MKSDQKVGNTMHNHVKDNSAFFNGSCSRVVGVATTVGPIAMYSYGKECAIPDCPGEPTTSGPSVI